MKTMNAKKKYQAMDLQLFADDGDGAGEEESTEEEDGAGDDSDDPDDDGEADEKKYSQKDIDEVLKKRLAREKRKWQREQQKAGKETPDGKGKAGDDGKAGDKDKETRELRAKAAKAEEMELKWTCLEHDVDKSSVDDVLALARVHMAKDEDLDIEDAIDKVLKKYPQFKVKSSEDEDEAEEPKKSWGQRQNGQKKKTSGVEEAFLKRNPGLKID